MNPVFVLSFILVLYLAIPTISALLTFTPSEIAGIDSKIILTSIVTAGITTTIASLLGIPLAYRLSRMESRFKAFFEAIIMTPVILPPIATGLLILSVISENGFLEWIQDVTGLRFTRSLIGIVLAQLAVASPFLIISAKAGFDAIDRRLEYASRLMGKSEFETFLKISIPLAMKSILAGIMMCFIRAFGEFGATFMLAYQPKTLPVELYTRFLSGGIVKASSIAVVFWFFAILFVVIIKKLGENNA